MELSNSFHNASASTKRTHAELQAMMDRSLTCYLSDADRRVRRRFWRALCGVEGCLCGGCVGERPKMFE